MWERRAAPVTEGPDEKNLDGYIFRTFRSFDLEAGARAGIAWAEHSAA